MLQDTGACIDRKKDKALQGKVELSINEVDISFTAKEICDKAGVCRACPPGRRYLGRAAVPAGGSLLSPRVDIQLVPEYGFRSVRL